MDKISKQYRNTNAWREKIYSISTLSKLVPIYFYKVFNSTYAFLFSFSADFTQKLDPDQLDNTKSLYINTNLAEK